MQWHTANKRNPPSEWARIVAVICLCLLLLTATVQAAHVHHPARLTTASGAAFDSLSQTTADPDSGCAFCASFHTVFQAVRSANTAVTLSALDWVPITLCRMQSMQRHFALFTRPPPALL